MKNSMLIVFILSILCQFNIYAKDIQNQSRQPDLMTSRNQMLKAQIETGSEEKKLEALVWIGKMVDDNSVDNMNVEFMTILDELATEPYLNPTTGGIGRTLVNDHPIVRIKVVDLLGKIQGPHAIKTLCTVLDNELNSDVLIHTMYSLSKIAENPRMGVTDSIYSMAFRLRSKTRISNELAYATLIALECIYDNGQDVSDPKVYWVLVTLNDDSYYGVVRKAYSRVMEKLWEV